MLFWCAHKYYESLDINRPIEEDDKFLASRSNLRVWMGDGSTAKFGKAEGTTNEYGSNKNILLDVGSYFLTHIGSPSSSLSPYSATRNLCIALVKCQTNTTIESI